MTYPLPPAPHRRTAIPAVVKAILIAVAVIATLIAIVIALSLATTPTTSPGTPTSMPTTTTQEAVATKTVDQFTTWMKAHYKGARWLKNITGHHEAGGVLSVDTNVNPPTTKGTEICQAISHYQVANGGFTGVRVYAADGTHLVERLQLSDPC